jgi:alkanesulfonate monooxygenase SsuD/methylene tetrahydromethanopterin reductase-like flavin-dependent oxidoreductase (luciferase family)
MDVSIGLPATIPGTTGEQLVEWARRADAGPFRSLGIIDRLVFPNFDPMVALAAAAAVTQRIRLTTTVLLAPVRDTGVLAKEAASLDRLSNGRLTLGLGVGAREDDFLYANQDFRTRGKRFDRQLEDMHRIWAGESVNGVGPAGPTPVQPGGPPIMIGGYSPAAVKRIARWGIGFISGGLAAERARGLYQLARETWASAGRPGAPRLAGSAYFGLGPEARERGGRYLRAYYGEEGGSAIAGAMPTSREDIRAVLQGFQDAGVDEVFLWPTTPDVDQVEELAEIVR